MHIFLIGMMGSGKSTVGKQLSIDINRPFIDTDEVIESKENMTINEIFNDHGENYFRKIESKTLRSLDNSTIVACGGGIIIDHLNRKYLKKQGYTIYLQTSISVLEARLENQNKRPLINEATIKISLENILNNRKNFYQETADFTITTDKLSVEKISTKILDHLKNEKNYS
jgi:shikimate kinase